MSPSNEIVQHIRLQSLRLTFAFEECKLSAVIMPPSSTQTIKPTRALVSMIQIAEQPHPLSKRDGKLLRLIPTNERLSYDVLLGHLNQALASDPLLSELAAGAIQDLRNNTDIQRKKCVAAWSRCLAYLHAGKAEQALRDAQFALAYAPSVASQQSAGLLPALHLAAAKAYSALQQHVDAAVHAFQAITFRQSLHSRLPEYIAALPDAVRVRLPLQEAGICTDSTTADACVRALTGLQAKEELKSLPEFKKPKEKYYYYKQWMRSRAYTALGLPNPEDTMQSEDSKTAGELKLPELPEIVMNKLLDMNADDLDLILKYPVAARAQVVELLHVFLTGGDSALATHIIEPPSWEEVQCVAGPCIGLPLGWNGGTGDDRQPIQASTHPLTLPGRHGSTPLLEDAQEIEDNGVVNGNTALALMGLQPDTRDTALSRLITVSTKAADDQEAAYMLLCSSTALQALATCIDSSAVTQPARKVTRKGILKSLQQRCTVDLESLD